MPAMTGVLSIPAPRLLTGASVDQTAGRGRQVTDGLESGLQLGVLDRIGANTDNAQIAGSVRRDSGRPRVVLCRSATLLGVIASVVQCFAERTRPPQIGAAPTAASTRTDASRTRRLIGRGWRDD